MKRMLRADVLEHGLVIDDLCSPPIAYEGARFNPQRYAPVYTKTEQSLIDALRRIQDLAIPDGDGFFHGHLAQIRRIVDTTLEQI